MKQNKAEEQKGIRIPPAVFFREILKGWRIIILAVILFAALLAGFRVVRYAIEKNSASGENVETAEIYEKVAAVIEKKIEDRKKHLAGSILVRIDPYQMAYAETSIIIRAEDPVVADDVLNRLSFFVRFKVDWDEFAKAHDTEPAFLHELISTSDIHEDNFFLIRIRHESEEEAAAMMEYLLEELEAFDEELQETVGPHENTMADWSTRTEVDVTYADYAESQFNRIGTLEDVLKKYKKLAREARGTKVTFSISGVLKYAVLGAALGFAAGVFLLLVLIFMRDRLLDARELKSLYGINSLAVFPQDHKNKKSALDRRIASIGRDPAEKISDEERHAVLREKLAAFAPDGRSFALIGDVKEKELTELAAVLSAKNPSAIFAPAPALEKKAASVRSVREADAVILVGKLDVSRFKNEERELEMADELGKKTVGSIVI